MRHRISLLFGLLIAVALFAAPLGCTGASDTKEIAKAPKKASTPEKKKAKPAPDVKSADPQPATKEEKPEEPKSDDGATVIVEKEVPRGDGLLTPGPLDSEKPVMPVVEMTQQHAATCLIKVGDALPTGQLPDLDGKPQDVAKLLGEKLTVVVFFREDSDASLVELGDLAAGVASPLAARGVKVIGVAERGTADSAREACKQAGVSYPVLLDADGAYFARLATGKAPRTYLLDSTGKVLWFDIDYSRGTRHDLREALRALVVK